MTSTELYNKVRAMCAEKDMTLNELAQACGRGNNYFYVFKQHEKGLNTILFWKKVSFLLGTTLDDLLSDK